MRLSALLGIIVISTLLATNTASAGLFIGDNEVHLEPFQEDQICFGVWTGAPGTTHHVVEISDELEPYVSSISPTEFDIYQVDCPQDPVSRRDCIRKYCDADNTHFCRKVCINFAAPFYTSLDTSEQKIEGNIKDIGFYLAAQTVVPQKIYVYYTPFNLLIILLSVGVVVVLVLLVVYLKFFHMPKPFIEKNAENDQVQSPDP